MKNFPTDEELLAARDAAFQQCRHENISAIIDCLTECNEFDVVEYDFSIRIDEAVVLVNSVSYIDGESFRVDYSNPISMATRFYCQYRPFGGSRPFYRDSSGRLGQRVSLSYRKSRSPAFLGRVRRPRGRLGFHRRGVREGDQE